MDTSDERNIYTDAGEFTRSGAAQRIISIDARQESVNRGQLNKLFNSFSQRPSKNTEEYYIKLLSGSDQLKTMNMRVLAAVLDCLDRAQYQVPSNIDPLIGKYQVASNNQNIQLYIDQYRLIDNENIDNFTQQTIQTMKMKATFVRYISYIYKLESALRLNPM